MIQTFTRKRIDILVDAPLCDWLVEQAAAAGIIHHSILPVESGLGRTGPWRTESFGTVAKRMFLALTNEHKAAALLERIAPDIERYGLVVALQEVEVVRGERF
ncbi:MAG: P-II family nitrogen regulator [Novosphingobium sp.]